MSTEFIVKFLGLFAGVLARSLLPWLRKLRDGEVQGFSRRYLLTASASLIIGFIISLIIFPQFNASLSSSSFDAYFKLFCLAFGFGFGFDAIAIEASQWTLRLTRKNIRRKEENLSGEMQRDSH